MSIKSPSINTLRAVFGENAPAAKVLFRATYEQLVEIARERDDECYCRPCAADLRLHALNKLGGFYGVESFASVPREYEYGGFRGSRGSEQVTYLNVGETYAPTLIFWRGAYRVQSVGDFIETMEQRGVRFE